MLKIGFDFWKILFVDSEFPKLLMPNGIYTIGCCDTKNHTIYISDEIQGELLKEVLQHEIAHAFMYSYGISLSDYEDEVVALVCGEFADEITEIAERIMYEYNGYY